MGSGVARVLKEMNKGLVEVASYRQRTKQANASELVFGGKCKT